MYRLNTSLSTNEGGGSSVPTHGGAATSTTSSSSSYGSLQGLLLTTYQVLASSSKEGLSHHRSSNGTDPTVNIKSVLSLPVCSMMDWMEVFKSCTLGSDETCAGLAAFLLLIYKLSRPIVCTIQSTTNLVTALQARQEVYIENMPSTLTLYPLHQSLLPEDNAWMYRNNTTNNNNKDSTDTTDEQQTVQHRKHARTLYETIAKHHYEPSPLLSTLHASPSLVAPSSLAVVRSRGSTSFSSPTELTVASLLFAFDVLLYRCQPKLHDYIRTSNASITDILYRWFVQGYTATIPFRQPGSAARWLTSLLLSGGWIEWLRIGVGIFTLIGSDLLTIPPYGKEIRSYLQTFPRRGLLEIKKLHTAIQQSGATPEKAAAALVLACSYHPRDLGSAGSFDTAGILYRSAVMSATPLSSNPNYDSTGQTLSQLLGQYRGSFGMKFKPLVGSLLYDNSKAPIIPYVCNPLLLPPLPEPFRSSTADVVSDAVLRFTRFGMANRAHANSVSLRSRGNSVENRANKNTNDESTPLVMAAALRSVGQDMPTVMESGGNDENAEVPLIKKDLSPSSNPTLTAVVNINNDGDTRNQRSASTSSVPNGMDTVKPSTVMMSWDTAAANSTSLNSLSSYPPSTQGNPRRKTTATDLQSLLPHRNEIPQIPSTIPGVMVPDPEALVRIIGQKATAHGELHDKASHHWHRIAEAVHRGSVHSSSHPSSIDNDHHINAHSNAHLKSRISPTSETYYVDAWKDVVDSSVRRRRSSLHQVSGKEIAEIDANAALNAIVNDSLRVLRMCRIDLSSPSNKNKGSTKKNGSTPSNNQDSAANAAGGKNFLNLVESAMQAKLFGDMVTTNDDNDTNNSSISSNEKRKISPGNKRTAADSISEAAKERMRNLLLPRGYSVENSSLTGSLTLEQIMNPLEHNIPTIAREIASAAMSSGATISPTKVVHDLLSRVRDEQDPMEYLLEKSKTSATEPGAVVQAAIDTGTDKLNLPMNIFAVIDQSNRVPASPILHPVESNVAYLSSSYSPSAGEELPPNPQSRFITQTVGGSNHNQGINRPQRPPPCTPGSSVIEMKLGTVFSTLSPNQSSNPDTVTTLMDQSISNIPMVAPADGHNVLNAGLNTLPPTTALVPSLEMAYPVAAALVKDMQENVYYPSPAIAKVEPSSTKDRITSVFDDAIKSEYPFLYTNTVIPTVPTNVSTSTVTENVIPTSPVPKRVPPPRPTPGYSSSTQRSSSPAKVPGTTVESAAGMYITGIREGNSNGITTYSTGKSSVPRYLTKEFSTSHILIGKPLQNILDSNNNKDNSNTVTMDDENMKSNRITTAEEEAVGQDVHDETNQPFYSSSEEPSTVTPVKEKEKKYNTSFLSSLSASLIENENRNELSMLASALLESATKTAQTPRTPSLKSSVQSLPLTSPHFAVAANEDFTTFKVNQSSLPTFTLDQRFFSASSSSTSTDEPLPSTTTVGTSTVSTSTALHTTPRPILHVPYETIHSPLDLQSTTTTVIADNHLASSSSSVTDLNTSYVDILPLPTTEEVSSTLYLTKYTNNDTVTSSESNSDQQDTPVSVNNLVPFSASKIRQTTLLLKQRSSEVKSAFSSVSGSLTPRTSSIQSSGNTTPKLYLGKPENTQSVDDLTSVASVRSYADEAVKKLQTISNEFLENNEI